MFVALLAAAAVQAAQPTDAPADAKAVAAPAAAAAAAPPPATKAKNASNQVVCTTEKEIGSLFSHKVCTTKAAMDERRQSDRDQLDKDQRGTLPSN